MRLKKVQKLIWHEMYGAENVLNFPTVNLHTKTFGLKFGHLIAKKKLQKALEMVRNSHIVNDKKVASSCH